MDLKLSNKRTDSRVIYRLKGARCLSDDDYQQFGSVPVAKLLVTRPDQPGLVTWRRHRGMDYQNEPFKSDSKGPQE